MTSTMSSDNTQKRAMLVTHMEKSNSTLLLGVCRHESEKKERALQTPHWLISSSMHALYS